MSGDAPARPDIPAAAKDCGCGPVEPCKPHRAAGDLQDREGRARVMLDDLAREIGKQDTLHPSGYPYTRDGIRLGIAAVEDETREVWDEWHLIRRAIGDGSADPGNLRRELVQVAAVCMRIVRTIDEAGPFSATCTGPDCGGGPLEPCKPHRDAGDLQDWEGRARAAEAKLAALGEYVRSRPSWVVDPVESRLRKDAILAIIGTEEAPDGS